MIVTTYKREFYRIKMVSNKEDVLGYLGDLTPKLMTVLDVFRCVQLLFNALDKSDCLAFNIFKELKLNNSNFKLSLILFDGKANEVTGDIKLVFW